MGRSKRASVKGGKTSSPGNSFYGLAGFFYEQKWIRENNKYMNILKCHECLRKTRCY